MIRNKLWLRITGLAVLALAAVVVATDLWPTETETVAESNNMGLELNEENNTFTDRPNAQLGAEELYQKALLHKTPSDPPDTNYNIVVDCCWYLINKHPDSNQAGKVEELLRGVPEQYRQQYERRDELTLFEQACG